MEMAKLKMLMDNPDYYTKCFHAFNAKKCIYFSDLAEWRTTVFPKTVLDKLAKSFPADTKMNILGIGSGSGETDSEIAASIKCQFAYVNNVVIEPTTKLFEMYRSLVLRNKSNSKFSGIEFDLRQLRIEEYRASMQNVKSPKYHFISAIHSLYYVKEYTDIIRYLFDCLEEGGVLLCVAIAESSGESRIWKRFGRFETIVNLRDSFASLGVPVQEYRYASRVDITSCFKQGSEEGELLIDFLSHTVDIRGSASPQLYQELLDYMGSDQCSEHMEDGTVLFNIDWDVAIAQKPLTK